MEQFDQDLKTYYVQMKDKIKVEHSQYLSKHPEIRDLLNDFVSNCLLEKPENVYEHAQQYFKYFNLKNEVKKFFPLVVCGVSGAGKGTMIKQLKEKYGDKFRFSVSYTTRGMRPGETDKVDYNFVSKQQFEKEIQEGNFLEYCYVHGNYYGTHKEQVQQIMNEGSIPLLDIDIQGAQKVYKLYPQSTFIWINVESLEIQKQRLIDRKTDSIEVIEKRINNAQKELDQVNSLNYFQHVTNKEIEQCFGDIDGILVKQYSSLLQ